MTERPDDLVVVGAGAAGLMTAIAAGRAAGSAGRIVLLDGARSLGAKILVAGGGRCNVTHHAVDEGDYAGSTPAAIRRVLRRFPVEATVAFFRGLGVELKREETGKLFPTTDRARTVLDALLAATRDAGATILHPQRVERVERIGSLFRVSGPWGERSAHRVVLATGGMALPKTGSDGAGYALARAFGHTIAGPIVPALVPLTLAEGHPLRELAGVAFDAEVRLVEGTGRIRGRFRGAVLCTHTGLSGPAILDVSRHWILERRDAPDLRLEISALPGGTPESLERELIEAPPATPLAWLRGRLPERLARTLCAIAAVDPAANLRQLHRDARRRLVRAIAALAVEPTGDRGFVHAEATAGGVPLSELHLDTMESRLAPGLHIVGELCDVDGRLGGFNFQWAWASGHVAGTAIGAAIAASAASAPDPVP